MFLRIEWEAVDQKQEASAIHGKVELRRELLNQCSKNLMWLDRLNLMCLFRQNIRDKDQNQRHQKLGKVEAQGMKLSIITCVNRNKENLAANQDQGVITI